jgi:hypothetical protein
MASGNLGAVFRVLRYDSGDSLDQIKGVVAGSWIADQVDVNALYKDPDGTLRVGLFSIPPGYYLISNGECLSPDQFNRTYVDADRMREAVRPAPVEG